MSIYESKKEEDELFGRKSFQNEIGKENSGKLENCNRIKAKNREDVSEK